MDTPIQGLLTTTNIKGMGTVKWHIWDSLGTPATIETCAYYIPQADIHLFSLQEYFSENQAGSFLMNAKGTTLTLPDQTTLQFGYHKNNNFTMASSKNSACTSMAFDAFTSQDVSTTLMEEHNPNLSEAQKKLLKWHWKLGHCMFQQVQALLCPGANSSSILTGTNQTIP